MLVQVYRHKLCFNDFFISRNEFSPPAKYGTYCVITAKSTQSKTTSINYECHEHFLVMFHTNNVAIVIFVIFYFFLQICLPSVVELFAELTSRYELLFCYTILEQNKRLVLSTASSMSSGATVTAAQTANPLDCFFPFDPYTLKRSVP